MIENPSVPAVSPRRLLSTLGGCLHSTDEQLLVVPVKLSLTAGVLDVGEPETNASGFARWADQGMAAGDTTLRLHIPKTPETKVRIFLVPPNESWNLRMVTTNAPSGYIDFLVDDASEGLLEGFIVLRRSKHDYTVGVADYGSAPPTPRSHRLTEHSMYPVLASVEDLCMWAASAVVDDAADDGFDADTVRAPSAIHIELGVESEDPTVYNGEVTLDSIQLVQPNVLFGTIGGGGGFRVVRGVTADFSVRQEDGSAVVDADTIDDERIGFVALQSLHGPQKEWSNAYAMTSVPTRLAGEVGFPMRCAWRRACLVPFSITLNAAGEITASSLCPGMRVYSDNSVADEATLHIDIGSAPEAGILAVFQHRATGTGFSVVETNLASGELTFVVDVSTFDGAFDGFILAHLDSER